MNFLFVKCLVINACTSMHARVCACCPLLFDCVPDVSGDRESLLDVSETASLRSSEHFPIKSLCKCVFWASGSKLSCSSFYYSFQALCSKS